MTSSKELITYEELSKHISRNDCWISIEGKVMNVSKFLAEHPGGEDILMSNSGTDATKYFQTISGGKGHTEYARSFFEMYYVGDLDTKSPVVLPKKEFVQKKRKITWEELAKHNTEDDCWIVLKGIVYDVTSFLSEHPGGPQSIVAVSGDDVTEPFVEQGHSENAIQISKKYEIGIIDIASEKVKKTKDNGMPLRDWLVLIVGLLLIIGVAVYFSIN